MWLDDKSVRWRNETSVGMHGRMMIMACGLMQSNVDMCEWNEFGDEAWLQCGSGGMTSKVCGVRWSFGVNV